MRTEQLKIVHSNEQNPQGSVGQYKQLNIYVNGVPKGENRKLGIKIHKKITAENKLVPSENAVISKWDKYIESHIRHTNCWKPKVMTKSWKQSEKLHIKWWEAEDCRKIFKMLKNRQFTILNPVKISFKNKGEIRTFHIKLRELAANIPELYWVLKKVFQSIRIYSKEGWRVLEIVICKCKKFISSTSNCLLS